MSQRDVVAEIRAAQPEVPSELRERVRLIAAAAPPERRSRFTRRRALRRARPGRGRGRRRGGRDAGRRTIRPPSQPFAADQGR